VTKVGFIWRMLALAQRMVRKSARDVDRRERTDARRNPNEPSSELVERNAIPVTLEASALSTLKVAEIKGDASSLSPQMQHDALGHPTAMNASLDVLAEQMLNLVEVVSTQESDIKALKARCQQLEEHDQAMMVAFTTFFHVLAAKRVARLDDITTILHNIIKVAQREAYPQESVHYLQRLAAMLHEQSEAEVAEVKIDSFLGETPP
jgi:hypothetical protein